MCKLAGLILSLLFSALSAWAQNPPYDEAMIRKAFAQDYAQKFVEEANQMQEAGDLQDIYGYFLPRADRKPVFKGFKKQQMIADGNKIIIKRDGKIAIEIEILDVLEQRYKINGQAYTHDWDGKARVQTEIIKNLLSKNNGKTAGLPQRAYDLMFPRAEAAFFLVPVAIQACVEGGCALAMFVAQRAAVYVATSPAIQVAAAGAATAFRKAIFESAKAATRKVGEYGKYVWMDLRTHPELGKALEALEKSLKPVGLSPSNIVYGIYRVGIRPPLKAAKWLMNEIKGPVFGTMFGFGAGAVAGPLINEQIELAKKQGIPVSTAIGCIIQLQSVTECAAAKPSMELNPSKASTPDYWCPTKDANEFQIYTAVGDKRLVRAIRVGTDGETKGKPVSAMRYLIDANGQVDPNSIRTYQMENTEVTKILRPKLREYSRPPSFMPDRSDVTKLEAEVKGRIVERDRFLKAAVESEAVILEGAKAIRDHSPDPLKTASRPELKALDDEVTWAKDISEIFKKLAPACSVLAAAQTPTAAPGDAKAAADGAK